MKRPGAVVRPHPGLMPFALPKGQTNMTNVHQRRLKRHALSQSQPTFFDWLSEFELRENDPVPARIDQLRCPMFSHLSNDESSLDICLARLAKKHRLPLRFASIVAELAGLGPREVA
jgi:hypothetical protein